MITYLILKTTLELVMKIFKLSVKLYVTLVLLYLQEAGVDTLKVLCKNYYCLDNTTIKKAQGGACIELKIFYQQMYVYYRYSDNEVHWSVEEPNSFC